MKSLTIALLALSSLNASSSVNDVGNIGPAGRVRLYYKNNNEIVLTGCPNTVLGNTPEEARARCQGKTYRFRTDIFTRALKASIYTDYRNMISPFTAEELEIYWSTEPKLSAEVIKKELQVIENFIQAYGEDSADLNRKKELLGMLDNWKIKAKFDEAIDALIKEISNGDVLVQKTIANSGKTFGHTLLSMFNPAVRIPCGQKGSIEERIQDCSFDTSSATFSLVTRSRMSYEVIQDKATGFFWGSNFGTNYEFAKDYCPRADLENGRLSEVEWKMPNQNEMKTAYDNGLSKILSPDSKFWVTSSDGKSAMIFNMSNGTAEVSNNARENNYTKCVGKVK